MTNDLMKVLSSGGALTKTDGLDKLRSITKKIAGTSTRRRISIKGNKFRQMVGGEQVSVFKGDAMNVIVVNSSEISRMYYKDAYDPKAEKGPKPTCWASDSSDQKPDDKVPEDQRQADSCLDCPQNVKGSGAMNSRACKYSQRLAVLVEGDWKNIYQLSLPAMSLFGDAQGNDMPFGAYARMLNANDIPIGAVVTELSFDEDSEVPKLFFKPVRVLDDNEIDQVLNLTESQNVIDCITLHVAEMDESGNADETAAASEPVAPKPKPKAKRKAKPKPKPAPEPEAVEEESEEVEEPTLKTNGAEAPTEDEDADLDSILDEWDDDEEDED